MCAKVFMKDPWEKTEFAPKRLRAFVDLVRPFTLLAPAIGGVVGVLLALTIEGMYSAPALASSFPFFTFNDIPVYTLISGIASLVFLNAASNALNQVSDRDIDAVNKSYRPIPSMMITPKEGLWIAVFLYAFAMWRAAMVNRTFVLLVSILVINTIFYSISPIRLKKRLWISNISIAIPRGLLGIVAAYSIVGDISRPEPWLIGSIMAIFLIGSTTTKDITDMKGDGEFGMRTLPVIYGKKKAIWLSAPFFLIPFMIMFGYWYLGLLPFAAIYMCIVYMIWSLFVITLLIKEGDREDLHFENSPAWKQMYFMLMGMQMGFLFIFIV